MHPLLLPASPEHGEEVQEAAGPGIAAGEHVRAHAIRIPARPECCHRGEDAGKGLLIQAGCMLHSLHQLGAQAGHSMQQALPRQKAPVSQGHSHGSPGSAVQQRQWRDAY